PLRRWTPTPGRPSTRPSSCDSRRPERRTMAAHGLEIRRSSASVWGGKTGLRQLPVVSKYIDTSTCIGCKACEVACQEWNDLRVVPTQQTGSYQTMPHLDAEFWNLIRFDEREFEGG